MDEEPNKTKIIAERNSRLIPLCVFSKRKKNSPIEPFKFSILEKYPGSGTFSRF